MKTHSANKVISLLTLGFFLSSQFANAAPSINVGAGLPHPLEIKGAAAAPLQLDLPTDLGTIQNLHSGSGPTLIHIQTAHGNYEAQQKIESILHYLKNQYGVKLVLLEGAASKLRPELLRFFPQRMDLTRRILDGLTKDAIVQGPERFLVEELNAEAYGIENIEAYRTTREAFKTVLTQQEKSKGFIQDMDMQIDRLTGPYLNKDLRAF